MRRPEPVPDVKAVQQESWAGACAARLVRVGEESLSAERRQPGAQEAVALDGSRTDRAPCCRAPWRAGRRRQAKAAVTLRVPEFAVQFAVECVQVRLFWIIRSPAHNLCVILCLKSDP